MRSILFPAAFALFTVLFLFGLATVAPSPDLYGPDNESSTNDHFNPAVLKRIAQEREEEILWTMGNLLNTTGTVTLYLSEENIPASEMELAYFLEGILGLQGFVLNLEMSESDIDTFLACNQKNLEYLSGLTDAMERFGELEQLEIRWNDPENPYEITSRVYEGEALRQKIHDLSDRYAAQKPQILNISEQFELNTTRYLQSVEEVRGIAERVDLYQEEQREAISRLVSESGGSAISLEGTPISLSVSPDTAVYRDVVRISGTHTGPGTRNRPIGIFIDGVEEITTETDTEGRFNVPFLIERIPAGTHTVYATDYLHHSNIESFRVVAEDTALNLTLIQHGDTRAVTFLVSLMTVTGTPVRNVAVDMYVLSTPAGTITMNESGWYEREFYLWYPTTYSYQAKFDPGSLPLNPSASDTQEIVIENLLTPGITTLLWTACLVFALSLGGMIYLRRSRRQPDRPRDGDRDPGRRDDEVGEAPEEHRDIDHGTVDVMPEEEGEAGVHMTASPPPPEERKEAIHRQFLAVREEAGRALGMDMPGTLTAREVLRLLNERGFGGQGDLKAFIVSHERHVYGNIPVSDDEYVSIEGLFHSVMARLGGELY